MRIKNVSMTEFKEFVLSQPDDRMIDVNYSSPEDIGCPLVHYSRNKFKRKVNSVGLFTANTDRECVFFDNNVQLFIQKLLNYGAKDYKKAKSLIQKSF